MFQLHGESHTSKCNQSWTKQKGCRKLPTKEPNQLHCKNLWNSSKQYCPSALWKQWCLRWNSKCVLKEPLHNQKLQPNSIVSAINKSVLVAEVLSKIRSAFKSMSYSDTINIISISASRIFDDKIEGRKVHNSIKNVNNNFTNVPTQQISAKSDQFRQNGLN